MFDPRESPSLVQLKVGGQLFGGWKTFRAEAGIEQASGAFDLTVMDRWAGQDKPWKILPGDACELLLADQVIITGFVDTPRPRFNKQQHGIRVSGRDKTMDLIDSSAIYKSGQWKRAKLDRIARDIAQPFGIDVLVVGDVGAAFDSFQIEMGERAFQTIDRAARQRGMLVTTDGTGRLILTRASTVKGAGRLVQGENILEGELELSWKERFSEITVKGQGKGDATTFGAKVAHGKASIKDDAITRYRPLIVISEQHGKGPSFAQRAEWERNVRRGRGTRAQIKVQGWTDQAGVVWRPNTLVPVDSVYLGIKQDLLIAKCTYSKDESGTFTDLQLVHPSAFDMLEGIRGTPLSRQIRGKDGAEDKRKHARDRARKKRGEVGGAIIDFETGKQGGVR